MAEDLSARCHHQSPCVKLLAFDSVDTGRKFLACGEKVRPSSVVTNHLLDVIQTLSRSHPIFSPTTSHISHVSSFLPSFLPSLLSYSRFLALAVSHPTAGVAMVFFKDLSSGSSFSDYSFTTRVCLSSLSQAMTWNEGFLPRGRFEPFLPLVAP